MPINFQLLLTLVSSSNAENAGTLWGFIGRYRPGVTPADASEARCDGRICDQLLSRLRGADEESSENRTRSNARRSPICATRFRNLPAGATPEAIQDVVYEIGRREPFLDHKKAAKDGKPGVSLDWFNMLYQVLLGQEKGPRFGSFVAAYGLQNTVDMIDGALARSA